MVVLTALGLEYEAVRAHLSGLRRVVHGGTVFETGVLGTTGRAVALAEVGPGNRPTAVVTERARQHLDPWAVLFVGVAGALKRDVALGDVVVASRIHAYESAKHTPAGTLPRPQSWPASHPMLQAARHALRGREWHAGIPSDARGRWEGAGPAVHFKPIAAGEAVLNTSQGEVRRLLAEAFEDAAAIEMEGAGLAEAASIGGLEALVLRGLSDYADGAKATADASGSQPLAAAHAAAAAAAVIAALPAGPGEPPDSRGTGKGPGAGEPGAVGGPVQVNTAYTQGTVNAVQKGSLTIRGDRRLPPGV
ncbi:MULTISPECIES: 5'-methylthioadenosine/S-adenosylhomocysteine nucleosidase [Kitasatospora]|uniref:5'-methylthioadenosine/S-adenosylhomocysteine nucleosidase family protein n=1 Tax=Kitasatospora TaxID=2063 RepID=UPI000686B0C8|nr:5'-methylthioadenosine/S-adenosylhomocysteine nucleosidase [Kitasatospora setae]